MSQSKVEWGGVRDDSYAWLQDKTASNPEVLSYLEQVQHTHCNTSMNSYDAFASVRSELIAHITYFRGAHLGLSYGLVTLILCLLLGPRQCDTYKGRHRTTMAARGTHFHHHAGE